MKNKKPFQDLCFTAKCAVVEAHLDREVDPEVTAFYTHAKSRKAKHKRELPRHLAAILKLRKAVS